MAEEIEKGLLPGFAVTLVKENEVLFQEAFGYADVEAETEYANSTIQPIASISRLAIMLAIDDGRFELDTKINDDDDFYINCYRIAPNADLTTPGAEALLEAGAIAAERRPLGEMLKSYLSENGESYQTTNFLEISAGQEYADSNLAASLAAYLVEATTGMPYHEFMDTRIFQPLEMTDTGFVLDTDRSDQDSSLFYAKDKPFPAYANDSYPDGFIRTSNRDLTKYMLEMINTYHGDQYLGESGGRCEKFWLGSSFSSLNS